MSKYRRFVQELQRRGYSPQAAKLIASSHKAGSRGTIQDVRLRRHGRDRRAKSDARARRRSAEQLSEEAE